MQGLLSFALSAALFFAWTTRTSDPAAGLLVAWWALELPTIGVEIGQIARQYPGLRNITLRLLEPLGAIEEGQLLGGGESTGRRSGVDLELRGVSVVAAGHTILADVNLQVQPGEHVAIVGPSGAGKSSFVGLLLGWHRPSAGEVRVDGRILAGDVQAHLRGETAWVDPGVQLWNRTVHENLVYGSLTEDVGPALRAADLLGVLRKLPDGLQEPLGEGGGLLSGGEGQRVRFGRALLRPGARLAILDEPFRGLDRQKRHELLEEARQVWSGATLLCVTHDVGETLDFSRVLVIEGGRVVEDGDPKALAADPTSRYHGLVEAEEEVRRTLWEAADWRRLRLERGRLEVR